MNSIQTVIVTVVCSVIASSGFWAYLSKRADKQDFKRDMLIGLAHDRIMTLGTYYLQRGWISTEEYENLHEYLYLPYSKLGGNGSAKRIMSEVDKLPFKQFGYSGDETPPDIIIDH